MKRFVLIIFMICFGCGSYNQIASKTGSVDLSTADIITAGTWTFNGNQQINGMIIFGTPTSSNKVIGIVERRTLYASETNYDLGQYLVLCPDGTVRAFDADDATIKEYPIAGLLASSDAAPGGSVYILVEGLLYVASHGLDSGGDGQALFGSTAPGTTLGLSAAFTSATGKVLRSNVFSVNANILKITSDSTYWIGN